MEGATVDEVLAAVHALCHNPDRVQKENADQWLQAMQKSTAAWTLCDQVLHRKYSTESCYMAAQTLRTKIQNSWNELPQHAHTSLRDSLVEHVVTVDGSTDLATVKQLALALADLALLMHAEWPSAVADMTTRLTHTPNPLHTRTLLELLIVLPEEVDSYSLRLGENRRNEIRADLAATSAPLVVQFLNNTLAAGAGGMRASHLTISMIKCFTSWLGAGTIRIVDIERQPVMIEAFGILQNANSEQALHEAATDCVCCLLIKMERSEEMDVTNSNCVQLEANVYNAVFGLREAYGAALSMEDTEKCINYCRVFTELGETMLVEIVNHEAVEAHFAMPIFDCVLMCCGHPDYELPDLTFAMWYRISEELYQRDQEALTARFRPHIVQLINALCRHCQMEPDSDGVLDDSDEFAHFRNRVVELIKDVVFVVGSSNVFAHMFEVLTQSANANTAATTAAPAAAGSWESMEAALFIMCAVARNLHPTEQLDQSSCVPQIVEAVLGIPESYHLAVRHTSLRLMGELAEWLEYNSQLYLERVLNWLLVGLQDRRLASAAATALQNVCSNCQRHMAPHLQGLVQILSGIDNLGIKPVAATGLIKGVAMVLSRLPHENIKAVMKALCALQLGPLQALLEQHSGCTSPLKLSKNSVSDPVLYLDRLAAILNNINPEMAEGQVHPCTDVVVSDIWPVLSAVCATFIVDTRIIERAVRTIRFAIRSLGLQSAPLLEPLVKQVVGLYQSHPHSCFLYLGSILVDEYAHLDVCITGLLEMLSAFAPATFRLLVPSVPTEPPSTSTTSALKSHPDTVDDFFRLNARFLQRAALPYLNHPVFGSVMECALHAAALDHREANASVMKFFYDLLHAGRAKENAPDFEERARLVCRAREQFGAKIVDALVRATVFFLPPYTNRDVADVIFELMALDRASVCTWLEATLKAVNSAPVAGDSGAAAAASGAPIGIQVTRKQLVKFHKDVTTAEEPVHVSAALREFARLWR